MTPKHGGCHECEKSKDAVLQSRCTAFTDKKGKKQFGSIALCTDCAERVDRGK